MKKAISLILSVMLLMSFCLSVTFAQAAEGTSTSGMVINKTATANNDGTYTVTLEAYATGTKVVTTTKKEVPTDIVLVLDQSGSMSDNFSRTTEDSWIPYGMRSNSENYVDRMNGGNNATKNLYVKLDDGSYVGVSVDRTTSSNMLTTYVEVTSQNNSSIYNSQERGTTYYTKVGNEYKEVTVSRSYNYQYTYTYTDGNGANVSEPGGDYNDNPPISIYTKTETYEYIYEYYYTVAGEKTVIGEKSTGADTVFGTEFYQKIPSGTTLTALEALVNAVATFTSSVASKAAGADGDFATTDDNVNHRIAMVGFAATANGNPGNYTNTELFIGSTQYNYNVDASSHYDEAFQDMTTAAGRSNISASIGALAASGGTHPNHGMEMANNIFEEYPVTDNSRHRVVIMFTDGVPGRSGFDSSVANSAISQSTITKETYGATVYSVGIFSGANATSAGNQNGTETQKANWFMQTVSSNNGTPQTPSYYLSAADAGALNDIFQQISDNIESGSSSTTLDEESIVKDIIAPQFTLPTGATAANITLETYKCTGKSGDEYTWTKNATAMGATATVDGDQVNVKGFDFAENYVAEIKKDGVVTGYQGHKLVIKFNVAPKAGFLGGNGVYTNTSAGIYEDGNATTPVVEFNRPQVDVPINGVTVNAPEKNVYLLATPTQEQLMDGAVVTIKDTYGNPVPKFNVNAENFGLEAWQYEYVDLEVTKPAAITVPMSTDGEYKLSFSMVAAGEEANPVEATGTINVFKPVLTFADSAENYLSSPEDAADYYNESNYKGYAWKHGETTASNVTMTGDEPELTLTYLPTLSEWITDGKVTSLTDVEVNVNVTIGTTDITAETTSVRQECSECSYKGGNGKTSEFTPEFIVHIKNVYGELKIVKNGLLKGESAVFTVKGKVADGTPTGTEKSWKVVLTAPENDTAATATITGLLVGSTYEVIEDANWTWTYIEGEPSKSSDTILALNAAGAPATVTVENEESDKWMNDESAVVNAYQD